MAKAPPRRSGAATGIAQVLVGTAMILLHMRLVSMVAAGVATLCAGALTALEAGENRRTLRRVLLGVVAAALAIDLLSVVYLDVTASERLLESGGLTGAGDLAKLKASVAVSWVARRIAELAGFALLGSAIYVRVVVARKNEKGPDRSGPSRTSK